MRFGGALMSTEGPSEALTELRITNFIAHIVDRTGALELSDLETPITDSEFPHDFFKQYIMHALTSSQRRLACFLPAGGVVSKAFADLSHGKLTFLLASQQIAIHLH